MPAVEVVVEQHDASRRHAGNDAPLVEGQGHGADAGVTAGVGEELPEVGRLAHYQHPVVSSREQVLPVSAQLHGPYVVVCLSDGLQLPIHTEGAEAAVFIEDDTVALSRCLDEFWSQAVFGALQSP